MEEMMASFFAKAGTVVGDVIREPYLSTVMEPVYGLTVRPHTRDGRAIKHGLAEVTLATGETLPVTVVGMAHIHPLPEAIKNGEWTPYDQHIRIRASDLTPEQARLVRIFAQHQAAQ